MVGTVAIWAEELQVSHMIGASSMSLLFVVYMQNWVVIHTTSFTCTTSLVRYFFFKQGTLVCLIKFTLFCVFDSSSCGVCTAARARHLCTNIWKSTYFTRFSFLLANASATYWAVNTPTVNLRGAAVHLITAYGAWAIRLPFHKCIVRPVYHIRMSPSCTWWVQTSFLVFHRGMLLLTKWNQRSVEYLGKPHSITMSKKVTTGFLLWPSLSWRSSWWRFFLITWCLL